LDNPLKIDELDVGSMLSKAEEMLHVVKAYAPRRELSDETDLAAID
jgi:hypothetical protein